ncbi:2-keto-4-pentenoate hydratase/2-oxohepta-3-ene-1,7-dioic acid hydratase (catechol pathway) [Enhydrobacter aerosaccus]|uniref:2-keto-4-pentenoate hydratase/2-oxohepta-3-ene-1,7-dioic acid hydratase (Catechol pathway) n=1 Tax=Enhydrobacter aerosaccus TaxID=225324 RepID=A0A1T4TFL0_9HYPH|nr:fumarylacetoacetate hydrolase family protein [Enhydrobacter aerosaccus]SKA39230.1 2-keto-4-pentenoate hydratase/2-oxohepta-3-ene-1,7-dioic acid hydratase (catechol pathway) [Enhydrobacter aerosaccus]
MRLCTILSGGKPAVGVKLGDGKVIDLSKQMPRGPKSVAEILVGGKKVQQAVLKSCAKPKAGATVSEKSAKYLAPIPNPGKILCIGLNYRKHAEETGSPIPEYPVVFCRFNNTLTPHKGKMPVPSHSPQLDWEAELAVVIGKKCRNVPKEKALSVIGGYACFNDGSVRDWQRKSGGQFTLGKNFDGTGGFGPDIVTPDELPPGGAPLRIMTRVNGKVMQDSNTDDLIFDVPTLVHELSKVMTLEPGDVIITGTPSGVAMARKPQPWLKAGDVCEIEIEKIGVLSNTIVKGA